MLKKVSSRLNITSQLVLFLLWVSILPLLILGHTSYSTSRNVIQERVSNYNLALMIEHKDHLEALLESVESLVANISGVEDIKKVLDNSNLASDTYTRLATRAKIGYILNGYLNLKGLISIDIFTNSGFHFHVGDTLNVSEIDQALYNRIYDEAISTDRLVLWTGVEDNININSTHKKVVTAAKIFNVIDADTLHEKPVALLLVNYSTDSFYDRFNKFDLGEGSYIMIIDTKNRLISHPNQKLIGRRISSAFLDDLNDDNGSLVTMVDGQEMLVTYSKSEMSGWVLVSLVPIASLTATANTILNNTLIVLMICFVFISVAAVVVSRAFVSPIKQITELFQQVQANELDGKSRFTIKRSDEIGELLHWSNSFLDSLEAKQKTDRELVQAKEVAEQASQKITVLNQQLESDNAELEKAMADLLTTQQELVQSEKMAALGQLIAGIAHEINTPLGAIQASIGNIADAMNSSIDKLPLLFQQLTIQQQTDFIALVDNGLVPSHEISFREERRQKRALKKLLDQYDVPQKNKVAVLLVQLGVSETATVEKFSSLLQDPNNTFILQMAYNLASQRLHRQNIELSVERASKVVFALKSYAHYDHSGQKIKTPVTKGLDVILTLYHNWLKQGVTVIKNYNPVPDIFCYPDELNQVWTNLIHNAIQAMENKGEIKLDVFSHNGCPNGSETESTTQYVIVSFTDNGPGIPDDIQKRIFDPFFTTKQAGEGSGLGLDIVRKIIEKHDGLIEFDSEPGKTTFKVWLPVNEQTE
ncbi:ATP-binding protein [Anaerolineales bacterium HSG24]|nr:ATP-binding protein [Anaerolineales bacterium HSG24]